MSKEFNKDILDKQFLTPKETAFYLNVSITTLWRFGKNIKDFPKPKRLTSKTILYKRKELDEFLQNKTKY